MVGVFDSDASDLAWTKGFLVKSADGRRTMLIKARKQLTVTDWEQTQRTFGLKGPNATVACPTCKNVIGRCEYFPAVDGLVHLHSAEYDKFIKHTPASYTEIVAILRHDAAFATPRELAKHEQLLGVKYDADSL